MNMNAEKTLEGLHLVKSGAIEGIKRTPLHDDKAIGETYKSMVL